MDLAENSFYNAFMEPEEVINPEDEDTEYKNPELKEVDSTSTDRQQYPEKDTVFDNIMNETIEKTEKETMMKRVRRKISDTDGGKFSCSECPARFIQSQSLGRHNRSKHSETIIKTEKRREAVTADKKVVPVENKYAMAGLVQDYDIPEDTERALGG